MPMISENLKPMIGARDRDDRAGDRTHDDLAGDVACRKARVTSAASLRAVSRRAGGNIEANPSATCESYSRKKNERMIAENAMNKPVVVFDGDRADRRDRAR